MGLLLLAFLVLTGVLLPLVSRWSSQAPAAALAGLRGDTAALVIDELQGAADLAVLDASAVHRQHLLARAHELDAARRRLGTIEGVTDALAGLFAFLAGLCILVLAIPLVTAGRLEGVFLAVLPLAAIAAFEAVQPLSRSLQLLDTTRVSARRLLEIVDTPPAVVDRPAPDPLRHPSDGPARPRRTGAASPGAPADQSTAGHPPGASGSSAPPTLDVRGLSFRYAPDEAWVLREVDLHLGAGERLALTGPGGCGKSTLLALLLRFWDYEVGSIRLDGREVRELAQDEVRARLSVVPQDVHLFDATIRDNLAVADGEAGDADMEEACRIAQLHDVIATLPAGYDTVVGENGVRLSGGERRRLAIARAVLKGASLVVLDEATADLDPSTEVALWATLDDWLAGRSVVIIAHEPPRLARVDRVLSLAPDRLSRPSTAGAPGPEGHPTQAAGGAREGGP
jgi:ATP-binding cassette subfamily C protein CydC